MHTDADFLAAIRANPDDDALRLVYADWLEDRGDVRGEFLRLDRLLAREGNRFDRSSAEVTRLKELRRSLERRWITKAGESGFGEVELVELQPIIEDAPRMCEFIENPDWQVIRTSISRLDRSQFSLVGLLITAANEDEYFDIDGGNGMFRLRGQINRRYWQYLDPNKGTERLQFSLDSRWRECPEQEICYGLETVLRAAKYVYYYRDFPPKLPYTNQHP